MNFFGAIFNFQDITLIAVVAAQSTLLAYLHNPKWKAFLLTIPLPSTFAILSVGRPIDITNITGLLLLFFYTHGVRILNWRFKIPIVPAIAVSAMAYCFIGAFLAKILPETETAFWAMSAFVLAIALLFDWILPPRNEPGHRSQLPVGVKLLIIVSVMVGLIVIKKQLTGFMTVFPMVGIIAGYECRHSLWTVCRQIPVAMISILPMFLIMRLTQPFLGYAWSLVPGWIVFLAVLILINPLDKLNIKKQQEKTVC